MTQTNHHPSLAILHRMASILDQVTKLSFNLSGLALAAMLLLIINEVVLRYFFNAPTTWSADVNQWFFALTTMLVLPEITRTNGNVAITVLVDRLPQSKKEIMTRAFFFKFFDVYGGGLHHRNRVIAAIQDRSDDDVDSSHSQVVDIDGHSLWLYSECAAVPAIGYPATAN